MNISITHIDTACILLNINGFRILTDPTLDKAGHLYYHGFGAFSRKTGNPQMPPDILSDIDLILLSHHQHKDNFDIAGKAFTATVENVISTAAASRAMPGIIGLKPWQSHQLFCSKLPGLKITATPAQHRPWWIPEFVSGEVTGFIIEYGAQDNGAIYISGDTVYFKGIEEVARRYKIDIGIFNVGSVQFRYLTGLGKYTMDGQELIKAVKVLDPRKVFPVHTRGWTHFKESEAELMCAIFDSEVTRHRTTFLNQGEETAIEI